MAKGTITRQTGVGWTQLETGDDLNALTEPGFYASQNAATTNGLVNCPASGSGLGMLVLPKTNGVSVQVLFVGSIIYSRLGVTTGWNNWYKYTGASV